MTFALSAALGGSPQTGFTSPVYNNIADTPPAVNAKQVAINSLGGTQAGVTVHSVSSPFTIAMFKPLNFKFLQPVNPTTGVLKAVPMNVFKVITRKGVLPLAGQSYKPMIVTTIIEVPAGADVADGPNVLAALSAHFGALTNSSAGIGDAVRTGTL